MFIFLEQVGVLTVGVKVLLVALIKSKCNNQLRIWTHDNFGEDLIINARNGGIYKWTENNGVSTRAVELSGISRCKL
jgi:cytochrome c biogenesis protein ResB